MTPRMSHLLESFKYLFVKQWNFHCIPGLFSQTILHLSTFLVNRLINFNLSFSLQSRIRLYVISTSLGFGPESDKRSIDIFGIGSA
jgi:hypothetical protein